MGKFRHHPRRPAFADYPAIPEALIVAGSDERGAMYGLYEVSERLLGTDPQKFWTDAVPHRVKSARWDQGMVVQGPPTFRFRGWFVNDEHALLGWHHREGEDNSIKAEDWAEIFETICRMRGNFYTLIEYGQTPTALRSGWPATAAFTSPGHTCTCSSPTPPTPSIRGLIRGHGMLSAKRPTANAILTAG